LELLLALTSVLELILVLMLVKMRTVMVFTFQKASWCEYFVIHKPWHIASGTGAHDTVPQKAIWIYLSRRGNSFDHAHLNQKPQTKGASAFFQLQVFGL
jgi:hypothetical protein